MCIKREEDEEGQIANHDRIVACTYLALIFPPLELLSVSFFLSLTISLAVFVPFSTPTTWDYIGNVHQEGGRKTAVSHSLSQPLCVICWMDG